jgi:hypothetical protein
LPTFSSASEDFLYGESYEATLLEYGYTDVDVLVSQIPSTEELQSTAEESSGYQEYLDQAQDYWDSLPGLSDLFDSDEETTEEIEDEGVIEKARSLMQNLINKEN